MTAVSWRHRLPVFRSVIRGINDRAPIQRPPRFRTQLFVAILFAVVGGSVAFRAQFLLHASGGDLYVTLRAAHILATGGNPYEVIRPFAGWGWNTYWFYPLPAAVLALPLIWFEPETAAVVFVVCSSGLLGFALARSGRPWAPILLSVPFWYSAQFAQMTPAILAFALMPAVAGLALVKPNLGLALLAWRPSLWMVLTGLTLFLGGFLVLPHWGYGWLEAIRHSTSHGAPVTRGVGVIGLLAASRWRRPEGRLLLLMTLAPNAMWFYDDLPIFLVARSGREATVLSAGCWLAWMGWLLSGASSANGLTLMRAGPWIIAGLYVPASLMVLARPNRGDLPRWMERRVQQLPLPQWARGTPMSAFQPHQPERD